MLTGKRKQAADYDRDKRAEERSKMKELAETLQAALDEQEDGQEDEQEDSHGFVYGSTGGENESVLNARLDEAATTIILSGKINNYLGQGNAGGSYDTVVQRNATVLFANLYPSFVTGAFGIPFNVGEIEHDILKGSLYITQVLGGEDTSVGEEGRFSVSLKRLVEGYRRDPDGSDYFEDMVGPLTYPVGKSISPSSSVVSIPSRILRQIKYWKDDIESGDEMDERMPNIEGIQNLLTTEITSQFYLTRHLFYWPVKTSVPMVVFTGIGGASALPEFQQITEGSVQNITLPYIVSTTYDLDVAKRFCGSTKQILCILFNAGVVLPVVSQATSDMTEREILLNNGTTLQKVAELSIDDEGYTYHYYRLLSFILPTREQVRDKIEEATEVWVKQLGLTNEGNTVKRQTTLTLEMPGGGKKRRSMRRKRKTRKTSMVNKKNTRKNKNKKTKKIRKKR